MLAVLLAPIALAAAVLAAHFYRAGQFVPAVAALVVLALLFVRRPWAARGLQVALLLGALEWVRTLVALVDVRQAMGQPWQRLALILGTVAVGTALAAPVFRSRAVRAHFRLPRSPDDRTATPPASG
jgi:hypothetical protein